MTDVPDEEQPVEKPATFQLEKPATFQYPEVWPQCSGCGLAWRLVRRLSFTQGFLWVWEQDCKHGRKGSIQPKPVMADSAGPLVEV